VVAPPTPDRPTGLQLVRQGLFRRPVTGGVEVLGRRLRRELDLNSKPGESGQLCVRGALGQALVCLDDRIVIVKRGFFAGAAFGAISATIYYRDVTGVQVGRRLFSGWIEIHSPSFQGGDRTRTLQNPARHDPFRQPNCLPMRRRHSSAYHEALVQIRGLVAAAKAEPDRLPVIDQLERLAMLRRRGDIDELEFELAKGRILGDASSQWSRAASS
jgi:hypothetical protein